VLLEDRQLIAQLRFAERAYDDFSLQTLLDNWRPPHAYLLRRRAALRLHQLQAWNPDTTVYMDREYFTLAALLGLPFLHVPDSYVCYHRWSTTQVSRRATYPIVFTIAAKSSAACKTSRTFVRAINSHDRTLFLLQQNWELWQPAFTLIQQADTTFALQHHQRQETSPSPGKRQTSYAPYSWSPRPRTLEDHARKSSNCCGWSF
jgi:hypothetical protein